nr:immunoglobulin heavy chain junction region [Macaca mulatta]MOY18160.1 immunoglobulin heavy chain junction region [Macaca mulatta]MOY18198.1 immunoglobulin heavy chain junction region [Macaca mulatta]MOY18372.1 immunoglobulin heavy chain junction region [Macaca mulatta]MOY18446.1 immunoglobulin heavy chain junction region [Macaca mulatta]
CVRDGYGGGLDFW